LEYTEDAVLLPPNSEKIQGMKAIEESIRGMLSRPGARDMEFTYDEMFECGETVTLIGDYVLKVHLSGLKPFVEKRKYICVWKLTVDGWKLHRDIYNSD
jgi:ketosteroid isomerase-like protein